MNLRIGVTEYKRLASKPFKTKTDEYIAWLKSGEALGYEMDFIRFDYEGEAIKKNIDALKTLDAIVFTGGQDVTPTYFGVTLSQRELEDLEVTDCVKARDEAELALAVKSLEAHLPILGICRGLQLINVATGGTLYLDIEKQANSNNHKALGAETSAYHAITLGGNSRLEKLIGIEREKNVSSRHHQAAEKVGSGLRVVAKSDDGIIEAMEATDESQTVFLVQWHPERMWIEGKNNAFSQNLLRGFLDEIATRKSQR